MTHITPVERGELPELEPMFELVEAAMGFVPTSMLTMAHWPELVQPFAGLSGTILAGGELERGLKQLVAVVVSNAAGCRYCQAHTIFSAGRSDTSRERLDAIWDYQSSDMFSAAEKAALDFALAASGVPNTVTDEQFAELQTFWDDGQIVEILAVIALYGFLNRWNDTLGTPLEDASRQVAEEIVGPQGWDVGKHV